jgi:hypothetical protein
LVHAAARNGGLFNPSAHLSVIFAATPLVPLIDLCKHRLDGSVYNLVAASALAIDETNVHFLPDWSKVARP